MPKQKFSPAWFFSCVGALASWSLGCAGRSDSESASASASPNVVSDGVISAPLVFEWGNYVSRYGDLGAAGIDSAVEAQAHWSAYGLREGRQGADSFNPRDYLGYNADLAASFVDADRFNYAAEHFLARGFAEGRVGAPFDRHVFDWRTYLDLNADLRPAGITDEAAAKLHWFRFGLTEGRPASRVFAVKEYLALNPDLQAHFGNDYARAVQHWLAGGRREGRPGSQNRAKTKQVGVLYSVWHGLASSAIRYAQAQEGGPAGRPLNVAELIQSRAAGAGFGLRDLLHTRGLGTHAANFVYVNQPASGYYSLYRKRDGEPPIFYGNPGFGEARPILDSIDARATARRHADQLASAGVDFVFLDASNLPSKGDPGGDPSGDVLQLRPTEVLFEEWAAYRAEGHSTPQIAVFVAAPATGGTIWADFLALYNRPEYDFLVARDSYSGKKLMFVTANQAPDAPTTQLFSPDVAQTIAQNSGKNDVAVVPMWAKRGQSDLRAGYMEFMSPCRSAYVLGPHTTSLLPASPCSQSYTPLFDSLDDASPNLGTAVTASASYQLGYTSRFSEGSGSNGGLTLRKTFERAFSLQPDYLLVSSWNEHLTQPINDRAALSLQPAAFSVGLEGEAGAGAIVGQQDEVSAGKLDGRSLFIDTYAMDYARDIEPTVEGGSKAFQLFSSCLRVYRKGSNACLDAAEACCTGSLDERYNPVYSFKNPVSGDYIATRFFEERDAILAAGYREIKNRFTLGNGFFAQDAAEPEPQSGPFYVAQDGGPARTSLYRCRAGDHFLSTSPSCEGHPSEQFIGYVSDYPTGPYVRPLTRCVRGGVHFHVTDTNCPPDAQRDYTLGFVK